MGCCIRGDGRLNFIFNGPPGSGKDEACHFLKRYYGYKHLQFKDQLFVDTAEHFGVSLNWFLSDYQDRTLKEITRPELNGMSKREALIHVSENVIKPKHGRDYFGVKTAERVDPELDYCFSDGGFIEEVHPLINRVGLENICIVQLYRTGCSFSSDSRNYIDGILTEDLGNQHSDSSLQKAQPQLPIRMYRIHNNTSVSDFHENIRKILRKEANADSKGANLLGKSI
jgi:hypothetical protein